MNKLQILLPPPGCEAFSGDQTFYGLLPRDKQKLFSLCNFKYMGDSTFETGRIPRVFWHIATNRPAYGLHQASIKGITFYILIEKERLEKYTEDIETWTETNFGNGSSLHHLADVVRKDPSCKAQGWIDIDEKVVFFVNEEMADGFNEWLVEE